MLLPMMGWSADRPGAVGAGIKALERFSNNMEQVVNWLMESPFELENLREAAAAEEAAARAAEESKQEKASEGNGGTDAANGEAAVPDADTGATALAVAEVTDSATDDDWAGSASDVRARYGNSTLGTMQRFGEYDQSESSKRLLGDIYSYYEDGDEEEEAAPDPALVCL